MDMRSRLYRLMQQLLQRSMYGRLHRRLYQLHKYMLGKLCKLFRKLPRNMHCQLRQYLRWL